MFFSLVCRLYCPSSCLTKVIYVETVTAIAKQILVKNGFQKLPKFPAQKSSDEVWYNEKHLGHGPIGNGGFSFHC